MHGRCRIFMVNNVYIPTSDQVFLVKLQMISIRSTMYRPYALLTPNIQAVAGRLKDVAGIFVPII